jgi:hypothetical protein
VKTTRCHRFVDDTAFLFLAISPPAFGRTLPTSPPAFGRSLPTSPPAFGRTLSLKGEGEDDAVSSIRRRHRVSFLGDDIVGRPRLTFHI